MKKAIIGTLVGAAVYFIWGFVSWMGIPWHTATVKALPQEQLISDTLKTVVKEPGFYAFPHDQNLAPQGPVGVVVVAPGKKLMDPMVMVRQFLSGLFISALLMWILWASRLTKVVHRIHLAAAVGIIAGLAVHFVYWNWFSFPASVTIVGFLDLIIGFIVAGAALSKFVPEA